MLKAIINPEKTNNQEEEDFIIDLCLRIAHEFEKNGIRPFITRIYDKKANNIKESIQLNIKLNKSEKMGSILFDFNPDLTNFSFNVIESITKKLNYFTEHKTFASNFELSVNYVPIDLKNNKDTLSEIIVSSIVSGVKELKKAIETKYPEKIVTKSEENKQ